MDERNVWLRPPSRQPQKFATKPREDPNYGIRLGLTGAFTYAAIPLLDPVLPPIIAALPVGLIAAQRRAFDPAKLIGGVVAMIVLPWIMTWLVVSLRPMPLAYVTVIWGLGMHGSATVETLRDGFLQAAVVTLVVGPIVYLLVPAQTRERHTDDPMPGQGNTVTGAIIRATVLLGLSFWLYAVMEPSDMMMAVVAAMVLVFPTRESVLSEALQRVRATLCGGALTLAILALFILAPYLPIILGLIFLCGLWLGQKMLFGPHPSMVYQYAFSVVLALVAGALSTQDAGYATFTRIVLTLTGAFSAAIAVALLDALTGWQTDQAQGGRA
ncbi:FUSC family protein [Thioclava sp. F34-6]|uniref:FUSC family protein n=1 Tax=Thioclava sp. F34-6 TaxID=1973003 RepID=UPI000B53E324|nr:FUSC family protein [Thioclava sp. F34-6]OWY07594.1 FUSC family protein [Thioclava sp. F34-6]